MFDHSADYSLVCSSMDSEIVNVIGIFTNSALRNYQIMVCVN